MALTKEAFDLMGLLCVADFEKASAKILPLNALDYYRSGANEEYTLRANRKAFQKYVIRPVMLRDVSRVDLSTSILGHAVSMPICISPSAMHKMATPEGEAATARAGAAMRTCMTLSTIATSSIEEVAEAAPDGLRWFQLYIYRDRKVTESLVRRAEAAGYTALVLTVDTPTFGRRLADTRNKFKLPPHLKMANFETSDVKATRMGKSEGDSGLNEYSKKLFDPSLTWEDIRWLRSITALPVVAKGILTGEDAARAVAVGVAGIIVSNHGARQLDYTPATIQALPEVVRAVGGRCEVYLDGGVRTGSDVVKAVALGARAVFLGRPLLWGLAVGGCAGATRILEILRDELHMAMMLSGCRNVSEIGSLPDLVVHKSFYKPKL